MYIVAFTSESGDDYLIGPFEDIPTHDEVMKVFRKHSPDEADYVEEMMEEEMWDGSPFQAHLLPDDPGIIDFQNSEGEPCPL